MVSITQINIEKLDEALMNSGMSRREIAEQSNISMGYLSLLLRGQRKLSIPLLNTFAEVTGIDLKDIVIEIEKE